MPEPTQQALVQAPTASPRKLGAFDQALTLHLLDQAAEDYGLQHGELGSPAYRAAWLRFRQEVQTIDDLHRMHAGHPRGRVKS